MSIDDTELRCEPANSIITGASVAVFSADSILKRASLAGAAGDVTSRPSFNAVTCQI